MGEQVGDKYGSRLHVWSWQTKQHKQVLDLGPDGLIPLEIRFYHEPTRPEVRPSRMFQLST